MGSGLDLCLRHKSRPDATFSDPDFPLCVPLLFPLDRDPTARHPLYSYLLETSLEVSTMATTSLSLGERWDSFIKREIARYNLRTWGRKQREL